MPRFYGTVLDPLIPPSGECAPTDRGCLNREWFRQRQQLPPATGDCPPNAKCQSPRQKRDAVVSTAGITDQWWFFPALVVGAWWLVKGRN